MTQIISQPDHGDKLIDKEGLSLANFQIFIDDVVRQFNLLEMQINPVLQLNLFMVATVPDPTLTPGAMIFVTDESLGPIPAYSDGVNWLRVNDKGIIS